VGNQALLRGREKKGEEEHRGSRRHPLTIVPACTHHCRLHDKR